MTKNTGLVLSACCLAMLSVGDNSTAVMAALPAMSRDLQLDSAVVEWVVNAYLLAAAAFILLGGEAADRYGARRSSTAGIALFALSSLIIAVAPSGLVVIGARGLQGLGGAFAVAGTLAAATESPESERAGAIAAWTGFLMLGFSIGPLVGGAVTHYAGWRFNFWLNVVAIAPAAILLAMRPGPPGRKADTLDWLGVALLAVFMLALIAGLRALPAIRSVPLATIVPAALAIISFVALICAERRHPRPLLDFNLLAQANLIAACAMAFVLMFGIMTLLLYYNLYAQAPEGFGMSAVAAGLSLLPLSVALFGFAGAAALRVDRLAQNAGGRMAVVHTRLFAALGVIGAGPAGDAVCRPVRDRRRDCAALRVGSAHRARRPAADPIRQGLRLGQYLQLSRRNGRRHRRRHRVRARGLCRRGGVAGTFRAGRHGACLAGAGLSDCAVIAIAETEWHACLNRVWRATPAVFAAGWRARRLPPADRQRPTSRGS